MIAPLLQPRSRTVPISSRGNGTHLRGRREIVAFHRQIFDTVVKGSRLEGDVKFVHFLGPALAVMHSVVRVTLSGHTQASPSRDSMQFIVVSKRDGEWLGGGLMNARRSTMERLLFLGELDSLRMTLFERWREVAHPALSLRRQRKQWQL